MLKTFGIKTNVNGTHNKGDKMPQMMIKFSKLLQSHDWFGFSMFVLMPEYSMANEPKEEAINPPNMLAPLVMANKVDSVPSMTNLLIKIANGITESVYTMASKTEFPNVYASWSGMPIFRFNRVTTNKSHKEPMHLVPLDHQNILRNLPVLNAS